MDAFQTALNIAQYNNAWSAEQAQKQMDFQERLSNTAHQREIADLKAAGLNPVLSANNSGASTPTGAMGQTDQSWSSLIPQLMDLATEAVTTSGKAVSSLTNPDSGSKKILDKLADSRSLLEAVNRPKQFDPEGNPAFVTAKQAADAGYYYDSDKGKYVKDERLVYAASEEEREKLRKEMLKDVKDLPLGQIGKAVAKVAVNFLTSKAFAEGVSNLTSSKQAYSYKKQQEDVSKYYLEGF